MTNAFSLELFQQRKQEESEKANFYPQDFSSHLLQNISLNRNKSRLQRYDK